MRPCHAYEIDFKFVYQCVDDACATKYVIASHMPFARVSVSRGRDFLPSALERLVGLPLTELVACPNPALFATTCTNACNPPTRSLRFGAWSKGTIDPDTKRCGKCAR